MIKEIDKRMYTTAESTGGEAEGVGGKKRAKKAPFCLLWFPD